MPGFQRLFGRCSISDDLVPAQRGLRHVEFLWCSSATTASTEFNRPDPQGYASQHKLLQFGVSEIYFVGFSGTYASDKEIVARDVTVRAERTFSRPSLLKLFEANKMKSVSEFLSQLFSRAKSYETARRAPRRSTVGAAERVEARLLLSATNAGLEEVQLEEVLYDTLVLRDVDPSLTIDSYFVRFSATPNESDLQTTSGVSSVTASEWVENGYEFDLETGLNLQAAANLFSTLPNFEYMHPDLPLDAVLEAVPNDPLYPNQWHFNNTGQTGGLVGADSNIEGVWDSFTGSGVTVGIVDSGLDTGHVDFVGNINTTIDRDFIDNDDDPSPAAGENHGTAVAGIVGAKGNNGIGVAGAAWDAEIVGLRTIGAGTTANSVINALSYENQAIDIYNNSWGIARGGLTRTGDPRVLSVLEQGATQGRNGLGNVYVWSAGNGALQNTNGNYRTYSKSRHTIAVGALLDDGTRAVYSNPGATTIISAYADPVTTADVTGAAGYDPSDYTSTFNGTSSAAPHVAGIVALMLDANPNLTYRDVVDILVNTGERVDPSNSDWTQNGAGHWINHEYGFGGIDASAAVDAALTHDPLAPEESYTTGTQTVLTDIPDNGAAVTRTVNVPGSENLQLEYVEVIFNATHSFIGDLEVVLTSPDGTQSVLAETRPQDAATAYNNYVFMSARHWDETSAGDWTITVSDGAAQDTGTFDSFELIFYGTVPNGLNVVESGGTTVVRDFGQTDTLDVSLLSPPSSDVVLNVTSQDLGEVTVSPTTLTFTPLNYNIPQTIDVSGVTDLINDGDQLTNVVISVDPNLSDPFYANLTPDIVSVTSIDNDGNLPGQPVVISPEGLIDTNRPTFEWTSVDNAFQYRVSVTDVFTGNLIQQEVVSRVTTTVLQSPFLDGAYEVTVVGINIDGQEGPASDPVVFGVGDPQPPGVPVINSPTLGSTVTDAQEPILFTDVPGALNYDIYMSTTEGVIRVEDSGVLAGNGLRSYITTTPFPEGNVSVWIRALDPFGGASDWSTPTRFLVDAVPAPQRPVITSPLVNVTANAFPEFAWIGNGANYELWVAKLRDGTGTSQVDPVFDRVVYLRDYIGNSYTHFNPLVNGLYRVWVRARNVAGEVSAWSTYEEFSVDVPVPDTPVLSVNVAQNSVRPQFSWTTSDETFPLGTTFDLWVNNLSTGEARVIRERTLTGSSFRAAEDLPQGRYRAWLQASSPLGHRSSWSAAVTFDIDIPSPGQPTVTGPVAAIGASDDLIRTVFPEFTWTAQPGAAFYELWVNHDTSRTARIVHQRMVEGTSFNSEQTPVEGSDETVEVPLPQGDYRAWTRAFNVSGEPGPWSRAFAFTIDVADPVAPVITAPVINAVGTVADPTPTIQWTSSGISVVGYQLQLEEVATGTRVLDISDINAEEYTIPDALNEIEYRVRVRGLNGVGEASDWSAFYNFRVDVPNASTPILLSPNGEQTGSTVTFEWQHSPLNTRYEILVRDLLRQENIVIQLTTFELDLTQTVALHTQNGFNAGTYRWWARAFNSENTASNWSASATFIVASNSRNETGSEDKDPFAGELLDADVYLAALPVEPREVKAESRHSPQVQTTQGPVRVAAASDRNSASKDESEGQQDANSVELIQVISELADPRSSLLLDGEQRS